MDNFKFKNRKRSKSFTLTVSQSFVTISDDDFGIVLPKSYKIDDAIEAFKDAKSAEELFINHFKTK